MLIPRIITEQIVKNLKRGKKVILIYGPRQAGKTTLAKGVIEKSGLKTLYVNGDQLKYVDILSSRDLTKLRGLVSGYDLLFIDEGQRIPEIGITLKILHDEMPKLKVLVTGSSSFLLSGRVSESLAGRKKNFSLFPLSVQELSMIYNPFEINDKLEDWLIFGLYPEVLNATAHNDKEDYLLDIASSYIYKDIIELEHIKFPLKINELLRLLAFQIGSQVSIHELGKQLGLNRETVERYIYLLEQAFIIFRVPAFSKNPRKEIRKSQKYYFYDLGVRNILINNMNPLNVRNDAGALWENFLTVERMKKLNYERGAFSSFFWRSYSGAEIDYVEEKEGAISAFEFKFNLSKVRTPALWREQYKSEVKLINRDNFLDFVL